MVDKINQMPFSRQLLIVTKLSTYNSILGTNPYAASYMQAASQYGPGFGGDLSSLWGIPNQAELFKLVRPPYSYSALIGKPYLHNAIITKMRKMIINENQVPIK